MLTLAALYLNLVALPYACPASFAVDANHMGPFQVGQEIATVTAAYNTSSENFEDDGNGGVDYTIAVCGDVHVVATTEGRHSTVYMLNTSSPAFETSEGAHTGMTVAELQRLYPAGKTRVLVGEGLVAVFDTGTGIHFDLDQNVIPRKCYDYGGNCDTLLRSVRAVDVYIAAQ